MGRAFPCGAVFRWNFLFFMACVYRPWERLCRIAPLLSSITTYSVVPTIHDFNQSHADSLFSFKNCVIALPVGVFCASVWVGRWDSCWWCYMIGWNMNSYLDMCVCLCVRFMCCRHAAIRSQCLHTANWLSMYKSVLFVVTLDDYLIRESNPLLCLAYRLSLNIF